MTTKHVEAIARDVYAATKEFYDRLRPRMGGGARGYEILYGPPLLRPPILFIGYQPGGDTEQPEQGANVEAPWPRECDYATANWPLAKNMRTMFDPLDPSLLARCTGLNAIFFRAPKQRIYVSTIPREVRAEIKRFCLPQVDKLVHAIKPQHLVAIGFATLKLFGPTEPVLRNERGVLINSGKIGDYRAIGTLHLSGAWISNADRSDIAKHILGFQSK